MSEPDTFHLDMAELDLPRGAYAGGNRHILSFGTRPVAAFTQGQFRPCIHPVWTPAGIVVTAESPVDHPHHGGIWCAADHVAGLHDGPDGTERYDYCFYVNEVFQGRAPGSIAMTSIELRDASPVQATICQQMQWLSPREWGARDCRVVMHETRTTMVRREDQAHIFDITCKLQAGDNPVEIGPTRHAWFNARVSDALALSSECLPVDDRGRNGAAAIGKSDVGWVDFCGDVGNGTIAGLATSAAHPTPCGTGLWPTGEWPASDRSGMTRCLSPKMPRCCFDAASSRMTGHCRTPGSSAHRNTPTRPDKEFRHADCPLSNSKWNRGPRHCRR